MLDNDSLIRDLHSLHSGRVPQDLDSIFVDRKLSKNAIFTNYYNKYLENGKFSDLINSDLDYVFKKKSPQLRPLIGSLGGGKTALINKIERIVQGRYPENAIVIKVNMSIFGTIDSDSLTISVYKEIIKKLRPHLKQMFDEVGNNVYKPYYIPFETMINLSSQDRMVEEKAFRELMGFGNQKVDTPEVIKGLNEFIIDLFSKSNKMLVILYDEVDMFIKLNKVKYPTTIENFTYTFLRSFTEHNEDDWRPIYVVFTCERETYEYIKDKCESFYRVSYNNEIIMKQFTDDELLQLANNIFEHMIKPIFGGKVIIKQLSDEKIQSIIGSIRIRPKLNETTPGYFVKDYLNEFFRYYKLDYDMITSFEESYESMAFDEFKKYVGSINSDSICERKKPIQNHQFDGYAEMIERGIPMKRAYGEFTMSQAKPQKAEVFINWLEHLKKTGKFDLGKGDVAVFISPSISPTARARLEAYGVHYIPFLKDSQLLLEWESSYQQGQGSNGDGANGNDNKIPSVISDDHSQLVSQVKEHIIKYYSNCKRRMYKTIFEAIKREIKGVKEEDVKLAVSEMVKDKQLIVHEPLQDNSFITFNFKGMN